MRYVVCVVLLLLAAPALPVVGAVTAFDADPAPADANPALAGAEHTPVDVDSAPGDLRPSLPEFTATTSTELRVLLRQDQSARWVISVTYELETANDTEAFREVAESFEAGETGPSVDPFRNYAAGAADVTGRQMAITDVQRNTAIDESPDPEAVENPDVHAVGELRLEFTWQNFLKTDGDRLVLGDAFLTPDGTTWLSSLGPDQTLYIQTPSEYSIESTPGVTVPFEDNAIVVEGPRTFEDDERVMAVYEPTGDSTMGVPWRLLAGAVVATGLIVAGAVLYRRRERPAAPGSEMPASPNGGEPGPAGGAGAVQVGEAASEAGDDADGDEEDLSLLSDEERVERLLERNDDRMRQADIVEETGWSDAKVSQLLSAMAEEGRVEKLRLGRENLISLPDDEAESEDGPGV